MTAHNERTSRNRRGPDKGTGFVPVFRLLPLTRAAGRGRRSVAGRDACSTGITIIALVLLVLISCKPVTKRARLAPAKVEGPQIRATVVTIRTTIDSPNAADPTHPTKKTLTHTVTISTSRARSSDEVDSWRLFDLKGDRVTFVDDIARTYRTESIRSLSERHRSVLAEAPSDGAPRVSFVATGAKRKFLQGIEATQYVISVGVYRRELWIAPHSAIPAELFSTSQVSEISGLTATTMAHDLVAALAKLQGLPMLDHSELPLEHGAKYVVDRAVIDIAQQDVPASYLHIGAGYRNANATATAPAGSLPLASSLPRDRSTRAEGSQPYAKDQTAP